MALEPRAFSGMKRATHPEFVVLSREEAERYEPRGKEICISISDPDAPPARVSPRFAAVLRLNFDDVTERRRAFGHPLCPGSCARDHGVPRLRGRKPSE